jgi:hypothetical protein
MSTISEEVKSRGKGNTSGKEKFAKSYPSENLTIWYKEGQMVEESVGNGPSGLEQVVESVRRARHMVNIAIEKLKGQTAVGGTVEDILIAHFRLKNNNKENIDSIVDSFELIRDGLKKNLIISLGRNKSLRKDKAIRGYTPTNIDVKNCEQHFHISRSILSDQCDHIARTIIHEASHLFADTHGGWTCDSFGNDDFGQENPEIYEDNPAYDKQNEDEAIICADSYAWAALSLFHDKVMRSNPSVSK